MKLSSDARKYVVVLTATIAPKLERNDQLQRVDVALRLEDYRAGLKFWTQLVNPWLAGIVFADNSGYPLDTLAAEFRSDSNVRVPVEFLSFDEPPPPQGLHYGYSELILLRKAIQASRLVGGGDYIIKATGRYTFPDIDRLVTRLPPIFSVAVDARLARPLSSQHRHYVANFALLLFSTRFFASDIAGLVEQMVPAPPWTRKQFIEPLLFDHLYPKRGEPGIILRWPCNCEPHGIGGNGKNYRTARKRLQSALRAVTRVCVPKLWI